MSPRFESQINMIQLIRLLIVILLLSLPAAYAAENLCADWPNKRLSQTDMNICSAKAAEGEQTRLDRLLADLRKRFMTEKSEQQWKTLEVNQKDWEQWVRNDCQWEAALFKGGSIQPMIHSLCLATATANRVDRLRIFLCEGQGMTGECSASRAYEHKRDNNKQ